MQKIKLVTFNIRYGWLNDGKNAFIHRLGLIYDKISKESPEIIAFQEIVPQQLEVLKKIFPEYDFYGQGRDRDYLGEGLYTAIKKSRLQVIEYETCWMSPTPKVPASVFEIQSEFPRICVFTTLLDKINGKRFRVINIHLDHIHDEARINEINFVLNKIEQLNINDNIPFIIAGDFNAEPDSKVIELCNNYSYDKIFDITSSIEITYHDYGNDNMKIDYIYVTESIKNALESTYSWNDSHEGIYLSDHYPVCIVFDADKI